MDRVTRWAVLSVLLVGVVVSYAPAQFSGGGSGSGAPTDATYITQTANGTLSAEQALGALATGFLKVTTTTGVVSSQVDIALTTDTSGNYVTSVATTSPITGGAAGSEGATLTLACATCALTTTTITVAGTANEITSSAGAQDLSANRTWTLSIPAVLDLSAKVLSGASPLVFEGLTADAFETTVAVTDPTAARTFTIPNANSVAAQSITCSGTNKVSAMSAAGVFTCSADSGGAADGTSSSPTYTGSTDTGTGIWFPTSTEMAISNNIRETVRFIGYAGGGSVSPYIQFLQAKDDVVSYAINCRKARGTPTAQTVITSGDDLCIWNGMGYVGAGSTYQIASYILHDSAGTISDSATGIGGIIDLATAIVGAEPALRMRIDNVGHVATSGTAPTMGACGTSPSVAGNDMAMEVTVGTGGSATSCAVTFANAWLTNAPVCIAQNSVDRVAYEIDSTTTAVTIQAAAAFTASSVFYVQCIGRI